MDQQLLRAVQSVCLAVVLMVIVTEIPSCMNELDSARRMQLYKVEGMCKRGTMESYQYGDITISCKKGENIQ